MLWSAPLQIAIAIYFLWQTLGPSVLSGLLVMILLIPINGAVAAKTRQFQMKQMKFKDSRVKNMNEILQGIKIIKLYGWEPSFRALVGGVRDKEIAILKKMSYLSAGTSFVWSCAPFVVSLVTFATYILIDENNVLDSQKAFVALSLFNILRFPLSMLPMMIAGIVQASVSIKRMDKYMNLGELDEKDENDGVQNPDDENAVLVKDGTYRWSSEAEPTLKGINMEVKKKSLVAVVGTVGSGKSSLMSAILGEMENVKGSLSVNGKVGFAAQQAWIQNATLKDNILFHMPLDKDRYKSVMAACALEADLKTLPAGDATEIGEKGINLSGGQKHRVALARVVYSDVDICLLDDPLSAVDAHVGKHIFDHVIGPEGLLANKTRIFVTHAINYLSQVDEVLVLKDGVIAERGSYQELLSQKGPFAEYLIQYLKDNSDMEQLDETELEKLKDDVETLESTVQKLARQTSLVSNGSTAGAASIIEQSRKNSVTRETKSRSKTTPDVMQKQYDLEKMETGKVDGKVYAYYVKNMGVIIFSSCIFFYTAYQVCSTLSSVWLSHWSDSEAKYANMTADMRNDTSSSARTDNLGIYGLFGIGQTLTAVFASLLLYLSTLKGSLTLHNNMLDNILRSPLSFFDTTPQGRILNRFGKDVDVLDTTMPMIFRGYITCLLAVLSTFLVISWTTPIFLLPITVIIICYYLVQR